MKDSPQNKNTSLILILVGLLLTSCSKENIEFKDRHTLIFERENPESFLFWDHHPDSAHTGYTKVTTGFKLGRGIQYEFTIEGDTLHAKAGHQIGILKWYRNMMADPEVVPVENGHFSHELPTPKNPFGFFVSESD